MMVAELITNLQTLYEFLVSVLPEAVVLKALGLAPVVTALVGLLTAAPAIRQRKKWAAPVLATLIGLISGAFVVNLDPQQWLLGLGAGLLIGLAAIGNYSARKNMKESRPPDQRSAA